MPGQTSKTRYYFIANQLETYAHVFTKAHVPLVTYLVVYILNKLLTYTNKY